MGRGEVLRIQDFRLLFVANSVSTVGNAFTSVAIAFGILDSTGSTRDIGLVLAARFVTQIGLTLVGGAWGDRVSRRALLVNTSLVSGASQAAIAVLFLTHTGSLWSLALIAAVNGASFAFAEPAQIGIVPQLVPADLLQGANALTSIVRSSAGIGGAALAGVLVAVASPGWALSIDAASYLASAALVTRISTLPATSAHEDLIAEVREGWREFVSRTWLWAVVVQFTIVNAAFTAAIDVYAPVVSKQSLGGPAAYGAITAALGVGGVLGGVAMLRFTPRRPLVAATVGILLGLGPLALLAAHAPLATIVVAALLTGVGFEGFGILWAGVFQHNIPPELFSRVAAYDVLGSIAAIPVGLALAGPIANVLGGVHHALWATTALVAAPTLVVLGVPDLWRVRAGPASLGGSERDVAGAT